MVFKISAESILFPEMFAIARTHEGIHASEFMCAIYHTCKIIVLSHVRNYSIFSFCFVIIFPARRNFHGKIFH